MSDEPVVFDAAAGTIRQGEKIARIPYQAARIFGVLAAARGATVDNIRLYAMSDPYGRSDSVDGNIRVQVSRIRRALLGACISLEVKNHYGCGYAVVGTVLVVDAPPLGLTTEAARLVKRLIERSTDTLLAEQVRAAVFGG